MSKEEIIEQLKQKNKPSRVILEFMPNPNFDEEFLEFVEEVLSWKELNQEKKLNLEKNENSKFSNN